MDSKASLHIRLGLHGILLSSLIGNLAQLPLPYQFNLMVPAFTFVLVFMAPSFRF
jgi:hypothetical protein